MGLALPMIKEVNHLTDILSGVSEVEDIDAHLSVMCLECTAQDPETLLDWLRDQPEPIGTMYIHQPLWSVEALDKFRKDADGLTSQIIATHQIYPDTADEVSYFGECRAMLADSPKWLFFKAKDND